MKFPPSFRQNTPFRQNDGNFSSVLGVAHGSGVCAMWGEKKSLASRPLSLSRLQAQLLEQAWAAERGERDEKKVVSLPPGGGTCV